MAQDTVHYKPRALRCQWTQTENVVCTRVTNCFYAHERLFWCSFPELRSNEGNKYQNNTRVGSETVRHESTYIILFLTRHNEHINDDKNNYLYTSSPCLTHSGFVCWWRHDWLLMTSQWPNNCDAITWIMISNSLDIDFIHGDIHGRPCKKEVFSCPTPHPHPTPSRALHSCITPAVTNDNHASYYDCSTCLHI